MPTFLVLKSAVFRIENIFRYTQENWGKEQANLYIDGMFERFNQIADKKSNSRPIPAEFEISGFFTQYEKHYIYWKELGSEQVGIVTVLHQRMHQIERFKEDFN